MRSLLLNILAVLFAMVLATSPTIAKAKTNGHVHFEPPPLFSSYTEIPGITEEEIDAVEKLKKSRSFFVYGAMFSTETFIGSDGEIYGFTAEFTSWLSQLFGIEFEPKLYDWDTLMRLLAEGEVDFTGELTPNPERRLSYFMTTPIAQRSIKIFRLEGQDSLETISKIRPLVYAFLEGVVTVDMVRQVSKLPFEVVEVQDYDEAYRLLKNRAADAFLMNPAPRRPLISTVVSQAKISCRSSTPRSP
jgi:ABC-type amino acid transport substrate-binding protein